MDILHLVDRLEELFNESSTVPLTHKVMMDEERLLDLIDQMRLAIPEEIKKSQQIINQKERIIAQAHEEANRTLELSKEQCQKMVERDEIVQKANILAEDIVNKAKNETNQIKQEADFYAIDSLEHLEIELSKVLSQVRNGIQTLKYDNNHEESQSNTNSNPNNHSES
jgi:cell division septum initiation protein DivIVA